MEIGKLLSATKMQFGLYFVISLVNLAIGYIAISNAKDFIAYLSHPLMSIASILSWVLLAVMIWAGYVVAKKLGVGVKEAGITTALITLISAVILTPISYIAVMPLMVKLFESIPAGSVFGAAEILSPTWLVIGIIIGVVIGFVLGAIGGFIGKRKK